MSNELVVLTSYFNPMRYRRRRNNYDVFMADMRKVGVTVLTIECAFGETPFELAPALDVIQIRSQTLLWQKERLLNLAASWLPASCKYVAWIDCDVTFDNKAWSKELVATLKKYPVAQLFESCIRLNENGEEGDEPDIAYSFASVMRSSPQLLDVGRYDLHGHTGYSWALRREIFDEVGLYDAAISGSADHFMAHAIYGDYNFCICNALKNDKSQIQHLKEWGDRFFARVRGQLGVVSGTIRHLWHGDAKDRRYFLRMHDITSLGFDPYTDLTVRAGQPLEWSETMRKTGLREYFATYFSQRKEDGLLAYQDEK